MDTIPNEILDLIMDEVRKLDWEVKGYVHPRKRVYPSKFREFSRFRPRDSETRPGYKALAELRQVNKAMCISASQLFFACIDVRLSELDRLLKLQAVSNGKWVENVQQLNLSHYPLRSNLPPTKEFQLYAKGIQSIFKEFKNLQALELHIDIADCEKESINAVIDMIHSLPLGGLRELDVSFGYYGWWFPRPDPSSNSSSVQQVSPELGLEHLKHLALADISWPNSGLWQLIKPSANIESLVLQYDGAKRLSAALKFVNVSRLRYLELSERAVSSMSADQILHLLQQCKKSIRYLEIAVKLEEGSWLQVLFQIRRCLKSLLQFNFNPPLGQLGRAWGTKEFKDRLRLRLITRDEDYLCAYAYNDILQQVGANREVKANRKLAAGLPPLKIMELPSLESVMEKAHFHELSSLPEL